MAPNAFIGKPEKPTNDELAVALGPAKLLWDQLIDGLRDEYNLVIQEWNSYSRKAGWSLRLKREKRNIVYLSPCRSCFMASFALGDKAIAAARESGLPSRVIRIINEAKRYAEGTGVRIDVTGPKDIAIVRKLAGIKLQN